MTWGFEIGRVYNRRNDIHAHFGGQRQGGVITPAQHPLIIIITGEEGLQHGYADRYRPDGAFEYFGEGQIGDMQIQKGNRAMQSIQRPARACCYSARRTLDYVSKARWFTRPITSSARQAARAQNAMR